MTATPPDDADLRPLDPRVRTLWWIEGGIRTAVLALLATPVLVVDLPTAARAGALAVVALSLVAAVVVPPIRYRRWRWAVREDDIWVQRGLLWITTSVVPFSRLQFVDTQRGPLERMMGLASLVLHTAALGVSTAVPGLAVEEAEALRERLARVDPDVVSV